MPVGSEEVVVDHETGETIWEDWYTKEISIKTAESVTITINDTYRTNPQVVIAEFTHDPSRIIRIRRVEPSIDQLRRERALKVLVALSTEGDVILKKCEGGGVADIDEVLNAWEEKTARQIEQAFDAAKKVRFLSNAPMRQYPHELNNDSQQRRLNRIYTRLGRLNTYIGQLSP